MLSDKIVTVLDTMSVSISDVARAGGCTPSNLNRIKNGVRTPPPSSPTIDCLTNGFIEIAHQRHMVGELCSLCGTKLSDSDEALRTNLVKWLYEDEPPYVRTYTKKAGAIPDIENSRVKPQTEFSKRLDQLMRLTRISNRKLGIESGLDPSYISRLRRGERIPRYHSPYLFRICTSLRDRAAANGQLSDLSGMTSISESELVEEDGIKDLQRWLFGYGTITGYLAADELMGTIASIDSIIEASHFDNAEDFDVGAIANASENDDQGVKCGDELRYVGVNGLRAAVTHFLLGFIKNGEHELLLYSDQSMDWMGGNFQSALTVLMTELIRMDVKIRVIHNIDRSMQELVSAIEWWMPLYLSGKILSYYCQPGAGKRFSHTLFIRPGAACIAGTSAIGLESRAVFNYSEDPDMVNLAEDAFNNLIKDSLPLVQIGTYSNATHEEDKASDKTGDNSDDKESDKSEYVQTGKVMVKASQNQVTIRRIEPPYLTFTFTHPMIVKAFESYLNTGK